MASAQPSVQSNEPGRAHGRHYYVPPMLHAGWHAAAASGASGHGGCGCCSAVAAAFAPYTCVKHTNRLPCRPCALSARLYATNGGMPGGMPGGAASGASDVGCGCGGSGAAAAAHASAGAAPGAGSKPPGAAAWLSRTMASSHAVSSRRLWHSMAGRPGKSRAPRYV